MYMCACVDRREVIFWNFIAVFSMELNRKTVHARFRPFRKIDLSYLDIYNAAPLCVRHSGETTKKKRFSPYIYAVIRYFIH